MTFAPELPSLNPSIPTISHQRIDIARWDSLLGRAAGISFGIATQALFLWTVVQLFVFLRYGSSMADSPTRVGLFGDALLAIGFALPHSLLLVPAIQKLMKRWVPSGLISCIHCSVTCLTLLVMFRAWSRSSAVLWHAEGISSWLILFGFYGSWLALFYSLYLTGLGYQTGLTQWWYWWWINRLRGENS